MSQYRSIALVCLLTSPAETLAGSQSPTPLLKLTNAACSGMTTTLSLDAKVSSFLVDAAALKLSPKPKEFMIMRKPDMSFFTVPWSPRPGGQEFSVATVKTFFPQHTFFPLRKGETLYLAVMSTKDEAIVACNVAVS
jgi:hypothetical protein